MPRHRITIIISPEGETRVGVNGVKGQSCKELTRAFEQELGKVIATKPTEEAYEQPIVQTVDQSGR